MPTMTQAGYIPPKQEAKKAPPKPQKPDRKPKKKKKKNRRRMSAATVVSMLIFLAAAAVGAATLYIYTKTQPYIHTFLPGTMLSGYPLAGATREDADALLGKIVSEHVDTWSFEIACMDTVYTLTAQDVALTVDAEATIGPLWEAGREGGMLGRYTEMLRLKKEPLIMNPVLTYDLSPVNALLDLIRQDVECGAVDATIDYTPGSAEPFSFTDDETGYALDLSGMQEQIEQAVLGLRSGAVTLEPDAIEPAVYRAELENAMILRAHLTVPVTGSDAAKANAALAVKALDGARVDAGETFSFNEAVGKRTAENGYQEAEEPAYGVNASGVGGGVCQASTALYRAALLGGMEVTQRSAAARPVDYCPMGQEAAVSDQGLDLVLVNRTAYPAFISARTYVQDDATYLQIMLIGEQLHARYALETLMDETGLIEEPVYVRDHDGAYATYSDERVPVGEALPGYVAEVSRLTLDSEGNETGREVISEDVYEAIPPTIYVGMKDREE